MAHPRVPCLGLALVFGLTACADDNGPATPDAGSDAAAADAADTGAVDAGDPGDDLQIVRLEYELADAAVLLEGPLLDALVSFDDASSGDLVFAAEAPGLASIARGTVLVAGVSDATPRGVLRTVTSVETAGQQVLVHTQQASLAHAYRSLDLEIRGSLPGGSPWDTSEPKDSAGGSASRTFGGDVDWIVFDGDGDDATDDDRVRVHGRLESQATYTFAFSYDLDVLGDINPFEIPPDLNPVDVDLSFDFDLDLSATVDLTAEGQASLSYEREVLLGNIPLPPFGVGPLVFTPFVRSTGRLEGGAPGSFRTRAGFTADMGGGLDYSVTGGIAPHVRVPSFSPTTPEADVEIAAHGRASVDIEVDLLLYGIIGPKAGVEVWAGVEADIHDEPCWHADVGIDGFVGVLIELFSVELVDWDHRWPLGSTPVASGSCPQGETFDPPPPWSVGIDEALPYTFAPDTATTVLQRAIDGTMLVAGQGSLGLYKVAGDGALVWARAWRDVDSTLGGLLRATAVAPRHDTGLLVATDADALLWLDAAGVLEEARRIDAGGYGQLVINSASTANDGTVVLATSWRETDGAARDVAVIRAAPDGALDAWRWGDAASDDVAQQIARWGDGFGLVVTSTNYAETPSRVSWLLRLNADGALADAWRLAPCDGTDDLALRSLAQTEDGHLVLGGYQRFSSPRAALVNVDPDGVVAWATLNGTPDLLGYDVTGLAQLDSGSWLAVGTRSYAAPDDIFVARTDSAGRFIWVRSLGGTAAEEAPGVLANPDGTAVVAAPTDSLVEGSASWWLTRLDVRDGALSFDGALPVRVYDDTFVVQDACVVAVAGAATTLSLPISATPMRADEEPAPSAWRRLQ